MVNTAMAYAKMGAPDQAEKSLVEAIKIAPDNAAAHFNLGLLQAEQNRVKAAERELREAFRLDPKMAPAAYNLCILTAKDRPEEALSWCRRAVALNPQEPPIQLYPGLLPARAGGPEGRGGDPEGSPGATARLHGRSSVAGRNLRATGRSPPGRGHAPPGPPDGKSTGPGPGPADRCPPAVKQPGTSKEN
jgi:tetratricopeptide (TPR) repeat protein